jgi:lipoprotein signal peptidase
VRDVPHDSGPDPAGSAATALLCGRSRRWIAPPSGGAGAAVSSASSPPSAAGPGRADRGAPLAEQPAPDRRDPDEPASGAPSTRRPHTLLLLALAAVVLVLDVISKLVVVARIQQGEDIRVLGGFLYLTHLRNVGAAFSFAQGQTILFSVIAVAVAVVIVRTARRLYSTGWAVALGLVLGGAMGNLVDRIFRAPGVLRGGVVDFLSLFAPDGRIWPVFNLADSAIVCGGILGAVLAIRGIEFDGSRSRGRDDGRAGGGPTGS